jgi:hypothetical protein
MAGFGFVMRDRALSLACSWVGLEIGSVASLSFGDGSSAGGCRRRGWLVEAFWTFTSPFRALRSRKARAGAYAADAALIAIPDGNGIDACQCILSQ